MATIDTFAQLWADWMLAMTAQLAVLILVLFVLDSWLRRKSATIRYGMWSLVLLRLMIPPTVALPTGWGWWLLEPRGNEPTIAARAGPAELGDLATAPVWKPGTAIEKKTGEDPTPASTPSTSSTSSTSSVTPVAPRPSDESGQTIVWSQRGQGGFAQRLAAARSQVNAWWTAGEQWIYRWAAVLLLIYLGSVCAQLGMLLSSALQVRSWARRASLIVDPDVQSLLDACRERVGVQRIVELRNSESCTTPLVVGLLYPVILIPHATLTSLSIKQLETVLTHELQHVRRRDGAVNLLQTVLGIAYFFHPLVWWSNSKLRVIREDVCDELTLHTIDCEPKHYAEALIKAAETLGYAAPPLAMGMFDGESPLKKRVVRILDPATSARDPWTVAALAAPLIGAAVLLPCAARSNPPGSQESPALEARVLPPTTTTTTTTTKTTTKTTRPKPPQGMRTAPLSKPAQPLIQQTPRESPTGPPAINSAPPTQQPRQPTKVRPRSDAPVAESARESTPQSEGIRRYLGKQPPPDVLRYAVKVEATAGESVQRLDLEVSLQWLLASEDGMLAMFRPGNVSAQINRQAPAWWREAAPDLFGKAHAQGWTRTGEPQAGDGTPLPLAGSSFASLLLPHLPNDANLAAAATPTNSTPPATWSSLANRATGDRRSSGFPEFPRLPFGPRPFSSSPFSPFSPFAPFSPSTNVERYRHSRVSVPTEQGIAETVLVWQGDADAPWLEGQIESKLDVGLGLPVETNVRFTAPRESLTVQFRRVQRP